MTTKTIFQPGPNKLRSGGNARIYATDGTGTTPIHGAIECNGEWELHAWNACGESYLRYAYGDNKTDLMPPKLSRNEAIEQCYQIAHLKVTGVSSSVGSHGYQWAKEIIDHYDQLRAEGQIDE
jgi:hypothetical protein